MSVVILKRKLHISQCEPGEYTKLRNPSKKNGWAWFVCPGCKHGVAIAEHHEVSSSGVVTPSFVCTYAGCTFHVFLQLEDWLL